MNGRDPQERHDMAAERYADLEAANAALRAKVDRLTAEAAATVEVLERLLCGLPAESIVDEHARERVDEAERLLECGAPSRAAALLDALEKGRARKKAAAELKAHKAEMRLVRGACGVCARLERQHQKTIDDEDAALDKYDGHQGVAAHGPGQSAVDSESDR